eukprot:GHVL01027084.1.p1 GENE.GHVL01027084.1~~GHVL01027084.1.p1  ORF type:complete len:235 (-),score=39.01 GHVL01027084.1:597-1301(-)
MYDCFMDCCDDISRKQPTPGLHTTLPPPPPPPIYDFSGIWRLDVDNSESPEKLTAVQGYPWLAPFTGVSSNKHYTHIIEHNLRQNRMKIKVTSRVKRLHMDILVDGSIQNIQTEEAGVILAKALWNGQEVVIEGGSEKGHLEVRRQLINQNRLKLTTVFTNTKGDVGSMIRYFYRDDEDEGPRDNFEQQMQSRMQNNEYSISRSHSPMNPSVHWVPATAPSNTQQSRPPGSYVY